MIEQIFCHLIGDFFLQTDYQALNKKEKISIAFRHAFVYTLPFIFLTRNILALLIIFISHGLIDHSTFLKDYNNFKNHTNTETGYGETRPLWITVWLTIIQDNTIHLMINYYTLLYIK